MSATGLVIVLASSVAAVCVFAAWILWRKFEFYEKRDEDDDANP